MTTGRDFALFRMGPALLVLSVLPYSSSAQCGVLINTFPYTEDFESGPEWTAGGQASDWEWGTPTKPLIDGPGSGQYSWVVGGLTGASYNDGEQSWLESPCFDLSSLSYPWISFKIFWETERLYDGLGFQYSLDQGATWTNVGTTTATQHCLHNNWFNSNSITGLNLAQPKQGWSGRVGGTAGNCAGGEGSGEWLTATHCLDMVVGEPSVKFRFVFGAGTICNAYDGIGIDDILIAEAEANTALFTSSCNGSTVEFLDASTPCPTSWSWDFGDPASGAANTSTQANPVHTYGTPGTYSVRLAVAGPCNAPDTIVMPITVIGVELQATDPGCAGNDGSIMAVVNGSNGPFTLLWTNGATTSTINGLTPGTYGVIVEGTNICPVEVSTTLQQQGTSLVLDAATTDVSCNGLTDGTASVTVSSGTAPYNYAWSTGGAVATEVGLPPGTHTCIVTDATQCTATMEIVIAEPAPLTVLPQSDLQLCSGASATLAATADGGVAPYTFQWSPDGPDIAPQSDGTYSVVAIDANGCSSQPGQVSVTVGAAQTPSFTLMPERGCAPHCVTFNAAGLGGGEALWDFGDGISEPGPATIDHCYTGAGTFDVALTVTDADGCSATVELTAAVIVDPSPVAMFQADPPVTTIDAPEVDFIDMSVGAVAWQWTFGDALGTGSTETSPRFTFGEVDCHEVMLRVWNALGCADSTSFLLCVEDEFAVYIPNAFTPNGDGINETFGVVTTVGLPDEYELLVFDRWGSLVHASASPDTAWDGNSGGSALPDGVYLWRLRMRDTGGDVRMRSGHVTLLR